MFFSLASVLALVASALAVRVTFDPMYDSGKTSLDEVACSTGKHGLETKGFTTLASLPNFPHIGGAAAVTGWNSVACGSCWALTFHNMTINILAIDTTDGFTISQSTMNNFTNGKAVQVGVIAATAVQVDASACGL